MTYHVDEEPVLVVDGICIEEECSTNEALGKEVRSEIREPFEGVETRAGFEHEEGNHLLDEQANDDGPPFNGGPVPRRRPETKLEHNKTHHGDHAIAVFRALKGRK